jgi:sporulation protein YabP
MNYEGAKQIIKPQNIVLDNRKRLNITGVEKIESLNSEEFFIKTSLGVLLIRGSNLEMRQFELEKGNLTIEGNIASMDYLDNKKEKKKSGFFFRSED